MWMVDVEVRVYKDSIDTGGCRRLRTVVLIIIIDVMKQTWLLPPILYCEYISG